jgi:chromosome segregation ATPase
MSNQSQPLPPLTTDLVNQILGKLKTSLSQTEGQITQMRSDAQSNVFNNVFAMFESLLKQKESAENELQVAQKTIEDIHREHPEIKMEMEKQKADPPKVKAK